jgi:RNA polymerase sigma-70 factor (ECF subfamily)
MNNPEVLLEDLLATDAWIRALARHLVADDEDAKDVAQDAWLKALTHRPDKRGPIHRWMGKVVRNLVINRRSSDVRRTERERRVARPERFPSVAELWDREETRRTVATAVFELEEPYRTAVLYRYFENGSPREIAGRLGISNAAVEGRLRRGLQKLRARLDREFGDRKSWCAALLPLVGQGTTGAGTAAGASSASVLTGAVVMSTKIKIGIAIIVALGVAYAFWPRSDEVKPPEVPKAEVVEPSAPVARKAAEAEPAVAKNGNVTEEAAKPACKLAMLRGVLVDPWKRGIDGVVVRILGRNGSQYRSVTRTDKHGRFSFEHVPVGPYSVEAVSTSWEPGRFLAVQGDVPSFGKRVKTAIPVVASDFRLAVTTVDLACDASVVLNFDAHSSLWGVVQSETIGASIEAVSPEIILGAQILMSRRNRWILDSQARFVVVWTEPGRSRYAVRVKARRSGSGTRHDDSHLLDFAPSELVRLDEGGARHVRRVLRLAIGGTLAGEVVYPDGRLPRRCRANAYDSRSGLKGAVAWNPESNSFLLKGLKGNCRFDVYVDADESGVGVLHGIAVSPGEVLKRRVRATAGRVIQVFAYVDDAHTNRYRAVLRRLDGRKERRIVEMSPRRMCDREEISSVVLRVPIGTWEIRVLDAGGRIIGVKVMTISPGERLWVKINDK